MMEKKVTDEEYQKAHDEGMSLFNGTDGKKKDFASAIPHLELAAERGYLDAIVALVIIYRDGGYGVEKDEAKAKHYYFLSGIGRD